MDDLLSIYQGTVVSNEDPLNLGRCRIYVPAVFGYLTKAEYDLLPWAVYISPNTTGSKRTTFILPKVGDVLWVQFIGGHKDNPAYFGSSFANVNGESELPLTKEEYFNTDVIYSSEGVRISKNEIKLTIKYGESLVELDKEGNITIKASKDMSITSTGQLNVKASSINVDSNSNIELNASSTFNANAGATANVKAPTINLN